MIDFVAVPLREKLLFKKVEKAVCRTLELDDEFLIETIIVDKETIRETNRANRDVDKVTDVLSFPSYDNMLHEIKENNLVIQERSRGRIFLGSIMICRDVAHEQAQEFGHSIHREMGFLFCHGCLHLLGFDHMTRDDEKCMIELQKQVMAFVDLSR